MDLARAMISVLAAWLLLAAVITGMGLGLRVPLRADRVDSASALLTATWTGFALLLLFLQLWHLVLPIRWPAALAAAVLGGAGGFMTRPHLGNLLSTKHENGRVTRIQNAKAIRTPDLAAIKNCHRSYARYIPTSIASQPARPPKTFRSPGSACAGSCC